MIHISYELITKTPFAETKMIDTKIYWSLLKSGADNIEMHMFSVT